MIDSVHHENGGPSADLKKNPSQIVQYGRFPQNRQPATASTWRFATGEVRYNQMKMEIHMPFDQKQLKYDKDGVPILKAIEIERIATEVLEKHRPLVLTKPGQNPGKRNH